jgi:hypothetical protein
MSLTQVHDVFAAIHEDGLDDLLRRFFDARPKYLNYGSPGFVAGTTVNVTQMPAIQFPGVPGGIDWAVKIDRPRVDAHPQSAGLPPELDPLGPQRVSIRTVVEICVACTARGDDQPDDPHKDDPRKDDPRKDDPHKDDPDRPIGKDLRPVCFKVEVFAIAHAERTSSPSGDALRLVVDAIELVDLEPNELESVVECLLLQILRAVLASVRLPLTALRAGAFELVPTAGPLVQDDQIEMFGNV